MGGQKGDKGQIKTENGVFAVTDTVKLPGGRIGHIGSVVSGSIMAGEKASMEVDAASHANTCRNHSATHLLQAALQEVLGDQVHQQGSIRTASAPDLTSAMDRQ